MFKKIFRKDKVQNATEAHEVEYLDRLKNEINSIENCNLKKNARQIIFGDGNINSSY